MQFSSGQLLPRNIKYGHVRVYITFNTITFPEWIRGTRIVTSRSPVPKRVSGVCVFSRTSSLPPRPAHQDAICQRQFERDPWLRSVALDARDGWMDRSCARVRGRGRREQQVHTHTHMAKTIAPVGFYGANEQTPINKKPTHKPDRKQKSPNYPSIPESFQESVWSR